MINTKKKVISFMGLLMFSTLTWAGNNYVYSITNYTNTTLTIKKIESSCTNSFPSIYSVGSGKTVNLTWATSSPFLSSCYHNNLAVLKVEISPASDPSNVARIKTTGKPNEDVRRCATYEVTSPFSSGYAITPTQKGSYYNKTFVIHVCPANNAGNCNNLALTGSAAACQPGGGPA